MSKNIDDWDNGYDVGFEDGFKEGFEKALKQKKRESNKNKKAEDDLYLSRYDKVIVTESINNTASLRFIDDETLEIISTPIDRDKINKYTKFDLTCSYTTNHSIYIDNYLESIGFYITGVKEIVVNTLYKKIILYKISRKKPKKSFSVNYDLNL